MSKQAGIGIGIVFIAAILGFILLQNREDSKDPSVKDSSPNVATSSELTKDETIKLVQAVSYLENLQVEAAIPLLDELLGQHSRNAAILQNKAVALLTQIKVINDKLASPDIKPEQRDELRSQLPSLFDEAAAVIEVAREEEPKNVDLARLDIIREERRIAQLPPVMESTLKQSLVSRILEELEKFPGDGVLTAKLASIAESIDRLAPEIQKQVMKPMEDALKANPRNGFLLASLIRKKVEIEDQTLVEWIDQALEIAKPQAWLMTRMSNGVDLSQELKNAAANVKNSPEELFMIAERWNNVFVSATTIQKLDAKATADIEPLSLIRLDQAYRQYKSAGSGVTVDLAKLPPIDGFAIGSQSITLPTAAEPIVSAQWFDWNVDLKPELMVATEQQVSLYELPPNAFAKADGASQPIEVKALFSVPLSSKIRCVRSVDLYEVKSELRSEVEPRKSENDEENVFTDVYHTTIRDIVVGTDAGIMVIGLKFNAETKTVEANLLPPAETNLPTVGNVTQIESFDFEADGDLDLVAVIDGHLHLFDNRGARNFLAANEYSNLPDPSRQITSMGVCDYDRDIDIDIVVSFTDAAGRMENIQHGQFIYRDFDETWQALHNAKEIIAAEMDGNVSWDWIARNDTSVNVVRTSNIPSSAVTVLDTSHILMDMPSKVVVTDLNDDSKLDLLVTYSQGQAVFWQSTTPPFGLDRLNQVKSKSRSIDLSYTVASEVEPRLLVVDDQSLAIQSVTNPLPGDAITFRIKGIADNNGGGRVNEYAIGTTLELFTTQGYQARAIERDFTQFGLGSANMPYSLRIIFPNGLTQTIVDPKANALIEEKQELKGSCPFLYGWDGQRWQLVTDLLWNAPLGLQVARGQTIPDRRWEYLHIPSPLMQAREGAYELRLTEELWETAYFDQVELLVIDHPRGLQVATNEKVGPPGIAEPGVWMFPESIAAPRIVDNSQRDWTNQLARIDGQYSQAWQGYICQGLVDDHFLEIDLPTDLARDRLQLLLTGWLHPTDTSLNIGIAQDPERSSPKPPSLQIVDQDGSVHELMPFMGFPGGKPKTITVDLKDSVKPTTKSIRISTSAELYWDQVSFINGEFSPVSVAKELQLQTANLQYRGFSELMPRQRHQPHWYDYERPTQTLKWYPMSGLFTRYGDCLTLVEHDDDRMVVMGSGDELTLRFAMQPIPEGFVREFILHNVGWDKDADLNTITGQTSLPLPFKAMQIYPAPIEQAVEQETVNELNRDTLTREQPVRQFWPLRN